MAKLLDRCPTLKEMLESKSAHTPAGEKLPLHSQVPLREAERLYQVVLRADPAVVLEVGMAFGVSSLAILTALRDGSRNGRLVSVDPVQSTAWKGCGAAAVARAGFADRHELVEDYDYRALPRLLESGLKCDFAYIDGWHTFDYTLLDWWYVDRMLPVGGTVGFNDCGYPAVEKVVRFVLTHRKYTEVELGLPLGRRAYRLGRGLFRRLTLGWIPITYPHVEDRFLRKDADWEPRWDYFASF